MGGTALCTSVHADTDMDAADVLVRDTEVQDGRVFVFNALAEVEVEVVDPRKVSCIRALFKVMTDGKGVVMVIRAVAAFDGALYA